MLATIFSFQGHLNHLVVRTAESLEYCSSTICDQILTTVISEKRNSKISRSELGIKPWSLTFWARVLLDISRQLSAVTFNPPFRALEDLEAPRRPLLLRLPRPKIFLISCSFLENLAKSCVGARGELAPPPIGNPIGNPRSAAVGRACPRASDQTNKSVDGFCKNCVTTDINNWPKS